MRHLRSGEARLRTTDVITNRRAHSSSSSVLGSDALLASVRLAARGDSGAEGGDASGSRGATSENTGLYLREEQRREAGCSGPNAAAHFHHGLLVPWIRDF